MPVQLRTLREDAIKEQYGVGTSGLHRSGDRRVGRLIPQLGPKPPVSFRSERVEEHPLDRVEIVRVEVVALG